MRIIDCEQRSPEWLAARLGVPTASEFGKIIQPVKGGYAAAADGYIDRLLDEQFRPDAVRDSFSNRHTENGTRMEPEAREVYAFEREVTLRQVGFVLNDDGTLGCSPDSLVVAEPLDARVRDMVEHGMSAIDWGAGVSPFQGGLEVKCPDGPTHISWLRDGVLPAEHKAQVHGSLIVTGLPWWDFFSYCPPYRPLIVRVVRDQFTANLEQCLARFLTELAQARELVQP